MSQSIKINFLATVESTHPDWRRRRVARGIVFTVVLGVALLFSANAAPASEDFSPVLRELSPPYLLRGVGRLLLSPERGLVGENDDRVNALLLGVGGKGHDGAELTDTIILASYQPSTKRVAMLSIPRDMAVQMPGRGTIKVNAVNAFAEMDNRGSGPRKTADVVGKLFDIEIPYVIKVDFTGFVKLVDELGGVLVHVDRPFTDQSYPAGENLYQTISFASGWQRMAGDRALIYARSRHGNNLEGSDFARSRRQQKIILAVKEELLTQGALANPIKVIGLLEILSSHVATNLKSWEILRLSAVARGIASEALITRTLDPESGGPLVAAQLNGAYMLVPKNGSEKELQTLVREIFEQEKTTVSAIAVPAPEAPRLRVEVQNGTLLAGFASRAAVSLREKGYTVSYIGNAEKRGYDRTVIYDLSGGRHDEELRRLRGLLDADISVTIPAWYTSDPLPPKVTAKIPAPKGGSASADFLVILGKSSAELITGS